MKILVCRNSWMETYQSTHEKAYSKTGWVSNGGTPFEALTFKPDDDGIFYGYVPTGLKEGGKKEKSINISKLGASKNASSVKGITVVIAAPSRKTGQLLVVGYYRNATVYKDAIERPDRDGDVGSVVRFTSTDAVLIPEEKRCVSIPSGRRGGMGQANVWYQLEGGGAYDALYHKIVSYLGDTEALPEEQESVQEYRATERHNRLERKGNVRRFIYEKGFTCESCEWTLDDSSPEDFEIWKSSFELHHLEPVANLKDGETREVSAKSFAVLCSSCHRAIHRSEYIDDVSGFVEKHPVP